MNKPQIKVDVVSDVVCPWCYIGKRRLEKAIDRLKGDFDVVVEYHPFELNPDLPAEGVSQKEYFRAKFGSDEKVRQLTGHVTSVAATEGLHFDFARQQVSPNTLNAHRLIAFAKEAGLQHQMKEALMRGYFEEGMDLSKLDNLVEVAAAVGLDREKTTVFLKSDALTADVQSAERTNRQRGITGVPFFIVNGKYGISGAQPAEVLVQALTEIGAVPADGEACDVDDPNC